MKYEKEWQVPLEMTMMAWMAIITERLRCDRLSYLKIKVWLPFLQEENLSQRNVVQANATSVRIH